MTNEKKEENIAMVSAIISKLNERGCEPGKTTIQKLVFFGQMAYNLPIEYSFEPYNYGPYSFELANDLENMEYKGILNVDYNPIIGFKIRRTEKALQDAVILSDTINETIMKLITDWGHSTPKELELFSTFLYIYKQETRGGQKISSADLIGKVRKIKYKHGDAEYTSSLNYLIEKGIIQG